MLNRDSIDNVIRLHVDGQVSMVTFELIASNLEIHTV